MIINFLLYLLTFNLVKYKELNLNQPNTYNSKYDEYKGLDERFPKNETKNFKELNNIKRYYTLKKIIKDLENKDNSILTKMNILDKYSFLFDNKVIDITKGGLMDDYNFFID